MADEGYKRVKAESGALEGMNVGGVDLGKWRKDAEERLGGLVKGVDLDKLREWACVAFLAVRLTRQGTSCTPMRHPH